MKLEIAKSSGFCFGVNRALQMIYNALDQGLKIATFGNVIHNKSVIDDLLSKGVRVIKDINEASSDELIIVRAHGVPKDVYETLSDKNYLDGTCPFVAKIHKIVSKPFIETPKRIFHFSKVFMIIMGDEDHPEIIGIKSHCIYDNVVIADSVKLKRYFQAVKSYFKLDQYINNPPAELKNSLVRVIFQTTFDIDDCERCKEIVKDELSGLYNYDFCDTICNVTKNRQNEANKISKNNDLVLVIGDQTSSNSQKLVKVCEKNCKTILIENVTQLDNIFYDEIAKYDNIGVIAGASTPQSIIKDIINKLEVLKRS